MAGAVKITISLPRDLMSEVEAIAKAEGKTVSAVIQDALREMRARRLALQFGAVQGFWCAMAKAKGILTDKDLKRLLSR